MKVQERASSCAAVGLEVDVPLMLRCCIAMAWAPLPLGQPRATTMAWVVQQKPWKKWATGTAIQSAAPLSGTAAINAGGHPSATAGADANLITADSVREANGRKSVASVIEQVCSHEADWSYEETEGEEGHDREDTQRHTPGVGGVSSLH